MIKITYLPNQQPVGSKLVFVVIFILVLNMFSLASPVSATSTINLASAGKFQILAGSVITLAGGVIGAEPEFDVVSSSAVADLQLAIASASTLSGTTGTADLGSLTYAPGVYLSPGGAAFAMTGDVILDGMGNANSEFIFYTPAAINTTAGIKITLTNGAQTRNIYWIAGGAITLGASNSISGIFMSSAAITTGAVNTFTGCLLSAAAVTVGAGSVFNPCPLTAPPPTCSLSISTPDLFSLGEITAGETHFVTMPSVEVTETCEGGAHTPWSVSVSTSDFEDSSGHVIGKSVIKYLVKNFVSTGGITTEIAPESALVSPVVQVTAINPSGSNTAKWSAKISVTVPIGQAEGLYSGTLIHSIY